MQYIKSIVHAQCWSKCLYQPIITHTHNVTQHTIIYWWCFIPSSQTQHNLHTLHKFVLQCSNDLRITSYELHNMQCCHVFLFNSQVKGIEVITLQVKVNVKYDCIVVCMYCMQVSFNVPDLAGKHTYQHHQHKPAANYVCPCCPPLPSGYVEWCSLHLSDLVLWTFCGDICCV